MRSLIALFGLEKTILRLKLSFRLERVKIFSVAEYLRTAKK